MFNWYEIRVKGYLEISWLDWFDGLQIQNLENEETSLISLIPNQLILKGVLGRLWDLGLTLLSLHKIEAEKAIFLIDKIQNLLFIDHVAKQSVADFIWDEKQYEMHE